MSRIFTCNPQGGEISQLVIRYSSFVFQITFQLASWSSIHSTVYCNHNSKCTYNLCIAPFFMHEHRTGYILTPYKSNSYACLVCYCYGLQMWMNVLKALIAVMTIQCVTTFREVATASATLDTQAVGFLAQVCKFIPLKGFHLHCRC